MAGLYGMLIVIHPVVLAGEHRWTMSVVAAISSALSAATALAWRRNPRPEVAHTAGTLLAGIALANTVLHFALFQQPVNTSNFVILILGMGLVMLSRVAYYSLVGVALASWLFVVTTKSVPETAEWGWFLLFSAFVGGILEEQRIHATRASGQREALLLQRTSALQDLVKAPALSETNLGPILDLVAQAARINLSASRVTIWLPEGDSNELAVIASSSVAHSDSRPRPPQGLRLSEELRSLLLENRTVTSNPDIGRLLLAADSYEDGQKLNSLCAGIISSQHVAGVILIQRESSLAAWTLEDQMFAASIADFANLAVQTRELVILEGRARKAEHLESLGVLAGGVAHDFNNLLTVVLGNVELLQGSPKTSDETLTSLESMMEAGVRARDLAQQMLAYAGRAHRETHTIDLAALGTDIDRVWAHDLLEGIDLTFNIDSQYTFAVDVDPTQIRQVILNLLTNARDAGASQITLSVGTQGAAEIARSNSPLDESGYHWLEVADDGSGMDASQIERIFEPFYTTRETGTGLGLAASLGIMRAHQGTLTVQSVPGQGSQFRIALPCSSNSPEEIAPEPSGELVGVPERTKVLLIEDEALIPRLATSMLKQSGREVEWFESLTAFRTGLGETDLNAIEFALIDVTLGDGSGLDAATEARKRRPDLPVILMSGYDARNVLEGQPLGDSVEFLSKPFSRGALQAAIEKAMGR